MRENRLDFVGSLQKAKKTPQGGLIIPAYLTRAGIFTYRRADGSIQKEFRPPEEVFSEESLETLRGAPITDGHPDRVDSDNWQALSLGHVSDKIDQVDLFVSSSVRVQEKKACNRVLRKDLTEVSCGYSVDIDPTPGEFNGEHYDAVQRNIRYNHVALGPKNWGRAGNDVRLQLDSYTSDMTIQNELRTDAVTVPDEEKNQLRADAEGARKDAATARAERDDAKAQISTLTSEIEVLKARFDEKDKEIRTVVQEAEKNHALRLDLALVASRIAPAVDVKTLDSHAIRCAVLSAIDPSFEPAGKTEDYVAARFDLAAERADAAKLSVAGVARVTQDSAPTLSRVEQARKEMLANIAALYK